MPLLKQTTLPLADTEKESSVIEHIPDLRIETVRDGGVEILCLEQVDGSGQSETVALHPIHVHYLAERLGIVDPAHRGAIEEVRALRRRLLILRDRIDELDDMLIKSGLEKHEDISALVEHSLATFLIAGEFC